MNASELQQNPERHFLSFHSLFIRFLPPFVTIDTTSVLRFPSRQSAVGDASTNVADVTETPSFELIGSFNTSAFISTDGRDGSRIVGQPEVIQIGSCT